MNKQNLWFIALFSLILVLSVYYISMPGNILEEYDNPTNNETEATVFESSALVALRVSDDEEVLNQINDIQTILLDEEKSADEKNTAYESLKNINQNKGKEEEIEAMLKSNFNFDSFVKISKDQVRVVISSSEHNKEVANNVIKKIQEMYDEKKYITVKFQ